MKHCILIGILFCPVLVFAQTENKKSLPADSVSAAPLHTENLLPQDTLSVPLPAPVQSHYLYSPFDMYGITPFSYTTWELHKGFNASIGMNVTFSPSKYAPSGVGFGQDAAFLYAVPLNKRLSVAGGLYASNFNWGGINYRNVGIAGIAAFKVNKRISLYAYGNKSLMPKRSPYYYPLPNFAPDRIGGMINFKFNESSSISIGVEGIKAPQGPYWW